MSPSKQTVAIIGGGPAALFAASHIDTRRYEVTIYEKNNTPGRKFLVAGQGGFNLTHSESIQEMQKKYHPPEFLDDALISFDNSDLRQYYEMLGIPTFTGSSGRVFPKKGIKPIHVLQSIIDHLIISRGVHIKTNWKWEKILPNHSLYFSNDQIIHPDIIIFGMGGASWKVTGSDGKWVKGLNFLDIDTIPFGPSNCGVLVKWPKNLLPIIEGKPLKNIGVTFDSKYQKGELVVTSKGLEGSPVYALSRIIQKRLEEGKTPILLLDLKPIWTKEKIEAILGQFSEKNQTTILKKTLRLQPIKINLIKGLLTKEQFLDNNTLSKAIKGLPIHISGLDDLDKAISTTGGIPTSVLNKNFSLYSHPKIFFIGEMVDWDAPTGGYLLQACASMGVHAAKSINAL